jgi:hypothetical protein
VQPLLKVLYVETLSTVAKHSRKLHTHQSTDPFQITVPVWDPYLQNNIDRLESSQRRAAHFVYNDYERTSLTEIMKKLDWKSLSERRREKRFLLMYTIVNNLIVISAETHITLNRGITTSSTASWVKLYSCNSDIYTHSFIPRIIIDWNNLSERCTRATSLFEFKEELRGQGVPPCD